MCSGQNLYSEVKQLGLLADHVHTQGRVALNHLHKPLLIQCAHMYVEGLLIVSALRTLDGAVVVFNFMEI